MKHLYNSLLLGCMLAFSSLSFSQELQTENEFEDVRPFRIGVKSGIPNLFSGNIEYVLPILNRKIAVSADYSKINLNAGDFGFEAEDGSEIMEQEFDYIEAGINYYFFKPGKGLYAGVSYAGYNLNGNIPNYAENENGAMGDGYLDFSNNSINLKAGAKWGGFFYFRPEVGYSFNPFPSSMPIRIEYEDGTSENQELDLDADSGFLDLVYKGLILNIGLGFSF